VCRDAATTTPRDIKKALQQFGRTRPDIALQLPKQLLADLASLAYPPGLTKKTYIALARLKTDTAPAAAGSTPAVHATGRASTQDVMRVMSGAAFVLEQGLANNSSRGAPAAAAAADDDDGSSSSSGGSTSGNDDAAGGWDGAVATTARVLNDHGLC
jgi:hypothetical protein